MGIELQKYSKILTGFSFFDQKWGGVYPGGNYLIFGKKKSGKTVLALNIIENLISSNYNVLLLTSQRKKSLEIQASSIYFDISEAISSGLLNVRKIETNSGDIEGLKNLINENNPEFIFIDEIIDESLLSLNDSFVELLEFLESSNITSFFLSSIPGNENAKQFVGGIVKNSTAIIHLQKSSIQRNYSGIVTLKPNIGYFEGEFSTSYKVEPEKGFITLMDNEKAILEMLSKVNENQLTDQKKSFEYSNIYSADEFEFLLESKIARSNKTGEKINVISYEIVDDNLKSVELCNLFVKKLSKSDKICFTDNMIYILPEDLKTIKLQELVSALDKQVAEFVNGDGDITSHVVKRVQLLKDNFKLIEH